MSEGSLQLPAPPAGQCWQKRGTTYAANWTGTTETDVVLVKNLTDDGAGGMGADGSLGTVNYTTGAVTFEGMISFDSKGYQPGSQSWEDVTQQENLIAGSLSVTYALADEAMPATSVQVPVAALTLDLFPSIQDSIVPGTLRFRLGTTLYSDRAGQGGLLYWEDGTVVGSIDYLLRRATITNWPTGSLACTIVSCVTTFGAHTLTSAAFKTAGSPLAPASVQLVATTETGDLVTGEGQTDRSITGTGITEGTAEYDIGFVQVTFDDPVYPQSLTYSATAYTIIPLRPEIIGIDPVRLPPDGRVPKLRAGDYCVVYEDAEQDAANPLTGGTVITLPQARLAFAVLEDGAGEETYTLSSGIEPADVVQIPRNGRTGPLEYGVLEDKEGRFVTGDLYELDPETWQLTFSSLLNLDGYVEPLKVKYLALVNPDDYSVDVDQGKIRITSSIDLTGYTQPINIRYRWHDVTLVVEAQTNGTVQLQAALSHDYSTDAALSALLLHGDLKARYTNLFSQNSDTGTWADYVQGGLPSGGGRYDDNAYPVFVTNAGAIRERWRVKRRSDGQWDVIGETLGVIQVWDGLTTLEAKRFSSQEAPYFSLYAQGLGTGWGTGNFIQFETFAAQGPLWVLRTVRPGQPSVSVDGIRLRHRVGAD